MTRVKGGFGTNALVPTHASHLVYRFLHPCLSLLLFDELGEFLLKRNMMLGGRFLSKRKKGTFVASSNLSIWKLSRKSGSLTCEAGYVVYDETCGQKPPSEPRASCPSFLSDGHGSCKPRVPHLTPSHSLPWPPPLQGPQTSPNTPLTPTSGSQTSVHRPSPNLFKTLKN